ncbi:MAG: hypothetical protein KDC92_03895 [Bacteroidetes bacterium]|nr:hypothetical protein [Bacteroidota bacterium]
MAGIFKLKMKNLSLLLAFFIGLTFTGCKDNKEPLSTEEMKQVSSLIIDAIMAGKLNAYIDNTCLLKHQPQEMLIKLPGGDKKPEIISFNIQTEQEVALELGNFADTSTKIAVIIPMVEIDKGEYTKSAILTHLDPKEVKKAIGGELGKRFINHLEIHFNKHRENYHWEVDQLQQKQIVKNLYKMLKAGKIAAYESENMFKVISPNELDVHYENKEVIEIPDPQFPNSFKDTVITSPIGYDDITSVRPFLNDKSDFSGISLMYEMRVKDQQGTYQILPPMPWVFVSADDLKQNLSEIEYEILVGIILSPKALKNEQADNEADSTVDTSLAN